MTEKQPSTIVTLGLTLALGINLALAAVAGAAEPAARPAGDRATATFSMYCYWTGEATLGRVDGVLASRIGHWGGNEIVQVDYDPQRTNLAMMVRALEKQRSFYSLIVGHEAAAGAATAEVDSDDIARRSGRPHFIEPKHSLRTRHPELWALGLSEEQAIALNSWSYFGGSMPEVLTAAQQRQLAER